MIDRRKAELIAYAVGAIMIVLLALRMLHHDSGGGARVALAQPPHDGTTTGAPAATHVARTLVVDVAGEVRRPGVYRVPQGARVDEAVRQAGGVTRHGESTAVNLAMPLHDGQQVVVPRRGAAAPVAQAAAPGDPSAPGTVPAQPVSLSTATVAQLDGLDGIGPTLATRIVQYRDAHGGFRSIDELRQVDGIGDKRFASLRKAVQP